MRVRRRRESSRGWRDATVRGEPRPRDAGRGGPPGAGKGEGMEPPARTGPADTLILAPGDPFQASELQNCRRINLWYFEPLGV